MSVEPEQTAVAPMTEVGEAFELSVVLPCLNEELTVGKCIAKAKNFLTQNSIAGEIIVADNGSSDRSVEISEALGAQVVHVAPRGYGNALRGGFEAARGKYVLMADSDDSYDLEDLGPFIGKLQEGYDLVMGNRFKGGIAAGAMPWHHRYVGNPALSFLGRLFFHSPIHDFHCGMRGLTREALVRMNLHSGGMELASEMVIKASLLGMKVCEVPTRLFPDGRDRPPHLRSFRDGWRHLRFLLIYSPSWLFLYPGLFFVLFGGLLSLVLFFGPIVIGFRYIDFHSFIASGTLLYLGLNMISFAVITRVYAWYHGLLPNEPRFFSVFKFLNLERGLMIGSVLALGGFLIMARAVQISSSFAQIGFDKSVRLVFGGGMALVSGVQIILASFVLSILGLSAPRQGDDGR